MSFLDANEALLCQIDQVYGQLEQIFLSNIVKRPELEIYWSHFYHIWMELCRQQRFASPRRKKRLKARLIDVIYYRQWPKPKIPAKAFEESALFQQRDAGFTFAPNPMVYDTAYGFKLSSTGEDSWQTFATGHYSSEYAETWLLLKLVKLSDTLIDVGANIGFFSILGATENAALPVHAFEPSNANRETLIRNVSLNQLGEKIKIYPCALGATKGQMKLNLCRSGSGGHTLNATDTGKAETVSVETLDHLLKAGEISASSHPLLKIDVEGFERQVLQGAKDLLNGQNPPLILFEAWPGPRPESKTPHVDVHQILWRAGYATYGIGPFKHGKRILLSTQNKPNFKPVTSGNYLAIPKKRSDILEILDVPVDARVFSHRSRLANLASYLEYSLKNLLNYLETP